MGVEKRGLSLQTNINMRSQAAAAGWAGESGVSVKQLQVSDWHFALLVASLANQPVGIHTWHAADCDHLGDINKYSVYCILRYGVAFFSDKLHCITYNQYFTDSFVPGNDWL